MVADCRRDLLVENENLKAWSWSQYISKVLSSATQKQIMRPSFYTNNVCGNPVHIFVVDCCVVFFVVLVW
jgi:hypothetical protein